MERKHQNKRSKKEVTTVVEIFYELLQRGCSDDVDLDPDIQSIISLMNLLRAIL